MRLDVGLFQAQVQKQILSPQMIQSMEILVLNAQQLEERIDQALEENIALEVDAGDAADADSNSEGPATVPSEIEATLEPSSASGEREIDLLEDRYEHLAEFQSEDFYASRLPRSPFAEGDEDDRYEALQNTEGRPETLAEHLLEQLRLRSGPTERQRVLASEVIYSLDQRGYLLYPISEMLQSLNQEGEEFHPLAPVSDEELDAAYHLVRELDPPGIGASDLSDCLELQLQRDPGENPLEIALVRDHLQDIAKNKIPQIAKAVGASLDDVKESIELIRTLNPIPGAGFSWESTQVVRPDVLIDDDEGVLKVMVTSGYLPKLRISTHYRELLQQARKDPSLRDYLRKKIENAEWLLSAIHQRKSTLQRVAEELVEYQASFFREGDRALRPLKMQDIADKIGVNVSTVSRAISGKYFQAPGMVRELKSLFTGGTVRDDGSSESKGSVILRIKDLIAEENRKKPLSDSKIVGLLAESGIHISRRTVTKYREAEGIPSSRERRQY